MTQTVWNKSTATLYVLDYIFFFKHLLFFVYVASSEIY